ncbi:MAG: YggS family pyridoxal phosphate-dependent enzyme [Crocinitomicaceae bacterium]|nr:YggS family pyridoxal phosphate-dependent enzyme [Crocinitomicaceae bacterium]
MIKDQLEQITASLGTNTTLVAVSKTHPIERIMEAYEAGQRDFGENKVQDLVDKYEALPKDIRWHMIGHLQSNKVKYIAPFVHLIHGVDSFKLLQEINKHGQKNGRRISCLLQFHIAQEDTKFGLSLDEATAFLSSPEYQTFNHVQLCGVMGMATFTENTAQIRSEFQSLQAIFHALKSNQFSARTEFKEISMGMSDDYPIAIEEGSTLIRVGSKIFGRR